MFGYEQRLQVFKLQFLIINVALVIKNALYLFNINNYFVILKQLALKRCYIRKLKK